MSNTTVIDRKELTRFAVPSLTELREKRGENAGARWKPVAFADMANEVASVLHSRGHSIKSERYIVSPDGHDIYSTVVLHEPVKGRTDMTQAIGWRMSNMQRFALRGVSGASVLVCSNGAIIGDFVFGHRMTSKQEIEVTVGEGMARWGAQMDRIGEFYDRMDNTLVTERDANHVLMTAMRRGILAPSQLGKVIEEFEGERNRTQFGVARTTRALYEAVTEVGKGWSSPRVYERGARGVPAIIAEAFGFDDLLAPLDGGMLSETPSNN